MSTVSQAMRAFNLRKSDYPAWDRASRRNAARQLYRRNDRRRIDPKRIAADLARIEAAKEARVARKREEEFTLQRHLAEARAEAKTR